MLPLGFFVPGLPRLCGPSATQVFVSSPEEEREDGGAWDVQAQSLALIS